jgi:prepilin-type N-terminal cleavage/methylation domain-containing protein
VKGFTLLEVMIALAIMAGVILTVITSFNYHLSVSTATGRRPSPSSWRTKRRIHSR